MGKVWSNIKGGKNISPRQSVLKKLDGILTEKFPNEQFTYDIEKACGKGDNYSGILYRISVKFTDGKQFKLILKNPSEILLHRLLFIYMQSYTREAMAYNEYLPLTLEFQKSKGLTDDVIFNAYPRCYGMLDKEYAIFLEDMCASGYQMFDRLQEMNVEHTSLVMKAYAKFHAVSFALKDQAHPGMEKFRQMANLSAKMKNPLFKMLFSQVKELASGCLTDEADAEYKKKFDNYLAPPYSKAFAEALEGKKSEPYSVVCHGDSWNNNLLFKYDDKENPIDVVIIDFQQLRYCTPITELMFYFWTNTTGCFRKKHYNDMLELYHKTLSEHLQKLGSDINKVFSYEVFKQELQKYGYFGLITAMFMLPNITAKPEDIPEVSELFKKGMGSATKVNEEYKKRMRDVIVDTIDYGYI